MKSKFLIKIIPLFLIVGLGGCQSTMYHWGDYSDSSYQLKNEPSDVTRANHKAELNEIILVAQKKNKKVPPSIHFELALLELEDGNKEKAISLLNTEKELFPESAVAVGVALEEIKKS